MTDEWLRHPGHLAAGLVAITVRVLPANQRDRYSDEFRSDLCWLPRGRQTAHALGLLAGALPLRRAVRDTTGTEDHMSAVYWKCRLGRHRYMIVGDQNPENRQSAHLECSRCLKPREIKEYSQLKNPYSYVGFGGGG